MSVPDSSNVFGALIFFAYMIAAIVLSLFIINGLYTVRPGREAASNTDSLSNAKLQQLVALAVLSFSVLSYHMLSFLIFSYGIWANTHKIALPEALKSIYEIIGYRNNLHIWSWATSSTLFQDFAEVICNDPQRWLWTQSVLLYSYAWNTYMAIKGHQLGVKHLWAYFLLDQILPVSYTQNLFLIATALMETPKSKELRQAPGLTWQLAPLLAYMMCLIAAPHCVGTSCFFPVLFLTRFLLFSRIIELRPTAKPESSRQSESATTAFPLFEDYKWSIVYFCLGAWVLSVIHLTQAMPFLEALAAINFNPAVSALGYDLLIGLASLVITAVW